MNYEMVLSTGKKVEVREPEIKDQDMAAQLVAVKSGDNAMSFAMMLQSEIIKMLIISVNGKILSGLEKDQLDQVFTYQEYGELQMGIKDILGEVKKPQINLVKISGDK